jgi:hypothetical protein
MWSLYSIYIHFKIEYKYYKCKYTIRQYTIITKRKSIDMEKRVIQHVQNQIEMFKKELHEKMLSEDVNIIDFVNAFQISLTKEDFMKRKRVKNTVPYYERCQAKRANGDRCSRRKKGEEDFCGTHSKSQPHGVVNNEEEVGKNEESVKNIVVHTEDIKGIIYYVDDFGNVYDPFDITNGVKNPKIIAKYTQTVDGVYSIPEFE